MADIPVVELLSLLVSLSEKAASLARLVRKYNDLFHLLVQEKADGTQNKRFDVDYKTLADVLIQETVKYFVGEKYPAMKRNVFGEESNTITNKFGEDITIAVGPTVADTYSVLSQILIDKCSQARSLAECVHKHIEIDIRKHETISSIENIFIDQSNLGIWIDPIDATNEFVKGTQCCHDDDHGIFSHGLQCVTVLMGMFDLVTGVPLIGIINQPFYACNDDKEWTGRCVWGADICGRKLFHVPAASLSVNRSQNICVVSGNEDSTFICRLESSGKWKVLKPAGCGYKLLCVIDKMADIFVLTKPSSYKWDTCGPHAILKSLGGNVISYFDSNKEIKYNKIAGAKDQLSCCNENGIIGCYSSSMLTSLLTQQLYDD